MDTRLISTFVTLARTRSFTAAAAELHLAQSTVTAHIQALERELRIGLFDRLPAGAVLTEAGQLALEHADRVLDAEAALLAGCSSDGPIEGTVTVGASESLCGYLLPNVIASLHENHPAVNVELISAGTAEAMEQLRIGRLSVALMLEPAILAPELRVEPIVELGLMFVAAPGHPLASTAPTWPELLAYRWFLLEEGCAYSDEVARALRAVSGARPQLTRLDSVEATRACVAAGLGLTVLPAFAVSAHVTDRQLTRFTGPELASQRVLLARHARRSDGRAVRVVVDQLVRSATTLAKR